MERFLVDQMLIRLGRWLRMMGMDVANPGDSDDPELLEKALAEGRTLLTRDKALAEACGRLGARCLLVKSPSIEGQLKEMAGAGIVLELNPSRCTICNCKLLDAEGDRWRCEGCGKMYWKGSHWKKIEEALDRIRKG